MNQPSLKQVVPDGYKQTEVGVIPDDWKCDILSSMLKEPPKYGINAAAVKLQGSLPVYIRITDISEYGYFKPSEMVGVNSPFSNLYKLKLGDLVLARTGASVGKSYLYKENDGELVFAGFLIKITPNVDLLKPEFIAQYLKTDQYWSWVTVNSMRSGQPGINGNEYGRLLIPVPSIKEQTAIANALSDVDLLLCELEKLITKKQAIKTATMQQLLTGKTRLPQFAYFQADDGAEGELKNKTTNQNVSQTTDTTTCQGKKKGTKPSELGEIPEDWEVVELGNKSTFVGSGKTSTKGNGEFPLFGSTGKIGTCLSGDYVGDALLVARVGANAGALNFVTGSYGVSDNTIIIKLQKDVDIAFYKYLLIRENLNTLVFGSGQPLITGSQLKSLKIVLPSIKEQTAIATILSDMDEEIQALTKRLSKTRQIKQGMMQDLLTGKTRLPYDKVEKPNRKEREHG